MTMMPPGAERIAALAFDRMLHCLAEGTALAICTTLILRLVTKANSHTRFVVRLSTLVAIALLPFLGAGLHPEAMNSASPHALVTIPASWAGYIVLGWMAIASAGLTRVAVGLWQVRGLRRSSSAIDSEVLAPETQ